MREDGKAVFAGDLLKDCVFFGGSGGGCAEFAGY